MKRTILFAVALVLVIVSGAVHGFWTGRWDSDVSVTPRLDSVGQELGDWQGEDIDVPPQHRPGISGILCRKYTNRLSGDAVTVYLVCGVTGAVSIHTPDACYAASGFKVQAPTNFTLKGDEGQASQEFKTARMVRTRQGDQTQLRIFWAWSSGGRWQVPEDARIAFPRQTHLCKLYLIHDQPRGGDNLDNEPCVELMKQLLPEMKRSLFAAGT
jgi:hypothetical protein